VSANETTEASGRAQSPRFSLHRHRHGRRRRSRGRGLALHRPVAARRLDARRRADRRRPVGSPGRQSITAMWRGKPVFIRNRTEAEIEAARETPLDQLPDRLARNENLPADAAADDVSRSRARAARTGSSWSACARIWAACRLSQQGDFGAWFCPCHGSHYDTAGRIRRGPAPRTCTSRPTNSSPIRSSGSAKLQREHLT
jgi:hypothetical protein